MARTGSRKLILVTGGAGFLGSHLFDRLLSDGHDALCADNLFTATKRNIEHLLTYPCFEFLRHDVSTAALLGDIRPRYASENKATDLAV